MAKLKWKKRNRDGYEQARPLSAAQIATSRRQYEEARRLIAGALPYEVQPAPRVLRPLVPNDPRITFVVQLHFGRVVSTWGRL